jgi:hypothetical protein
VENHKGIFNPNKREVKKHTNDIDWRLPEITDGLGSFSLHQVAAKKPCKWMNISTSNRERNTWQRGGQGDRGKLRTSRSTDGLSSSRGNSEPATNPRKMGVRGYYLFIEKSGHR